MKRMHSVAIGSLAVLALAAPAFGASTDGSTYVPGRGVDPAPYTVEHSATQRSLPRGGGPTSSAQRNVHARPAIVHPRGSNAHLRSDNQTRRPGAVNYTGPSFKDTESAHGVPDAPPVSLAGDHFESHTGARTTGPIAVRAASSNEMDIVKRPVPTARGGGPAAGPYVVAPGGHIEMLAPSRPLAWSANMPRLAVKAPSALSLSDVRSLPYRGDGTAHRRATGLLSMMPRVGPGHLIDTMGVAGAEPTRERAAVGFGARATGGGPRARSVDSNGR